jgi:hypothetical protein
MSMLIVVKINPNAFENPVHQGMHVLATLKRASVPALGVLGVTGVESGKLTINETDLCEGSVVYEWEA